MEEDTDAEPKKDINEVTHIHMPVDRFTEIDRFTPGNAETKMHGETQGVKTQTLERPRETAPGEMPRKRNRDDRQGETETLRGRRGGWLP